ncbi:hypothetical protein MNV49_004281 [Pseudohyphozyma bogoriensis]|nr:hypothetical protein MNV49_004281 [Pseudohyphozyma bogoriensis]
MLRTSLIRSSPLLVRHAASRVVVPAAQRGFLTVVSQGSQAQRLSLGKSPKTLDPGLHFYVPLYHMIHKVDMRERAVPVSNLQAYTSDNVPVETSATLFYQITDARKACFDVQDYASSTRAVGTSALRSTIGKFSYDDIISDRNRLNAALAESVRASVETWGVQVAKAEIQDFKPANANVERQLEQQMEGERLRRRQLLDTEAQVNIAEGHKRRTILQSEGELEAKRNQAEGDAIATIKSGEALAAQINAIATGLAAASSSSSGPSEAVLMKAADMIVEMRRQDVLREMASEGNSTYFLSEKLARGGHVEQYEIDNGEKWKKSVLDKTRLSSLPTDA